MDLEYNDIDKITENIYLGNLCGAGDIDLLKKLGIKKVLSLLEEFGWPKYDESDNIVHKAYKIQDYDRENIIKYFGECFDFIKGEDKILVHCAAGASRSATVVIAYIMFIKKMSYKDALEFVRNKRFVVYPNPGFRDQLELFEKELIEKNYDIDKIKFGEIKWEPKDNYEYEF